MKAFGMTALFVGILYVAAPHAASADAAGKRIATLIGSTKTPFSAKLAATIKQEGDARGMKVTVFSAGFDAAVQARQVDDAVAQKYDLLAIVPADEHAIVPALVRAKAAGVPVVVVNSPIEAGHDDLYLSFVGEDQEALGRLTGEALLHAIEDRKTAKVAILAGAMTESVSQQRIKGFKEVTAKDARVKVLATEDTRWDMAASERIAGQLFARFAGQGGLDAIFAMADSLANGAIAAAKAADIPLGTDAGKLVVVSANCMKYGVTNIKAGDQYSTGTQMPARTGKAAVDLIEAHFSGKTLSKENILPMETITRANIDQYTDLCTF